MSSERNSERTKKKYYILLTVHLDTSV